jgi:tRNA threonylcarbamoyl adenosine modification protein YeaZ
MQLAIDTSTEITSIALSHKGEIAAESIWHCGQNHTMELLPHLIHLLDQTKVSLDSIDGIVVAKGPGSFNGLRVGMSTAKGFAFALGIPLVSISNLEVEAYPYAATNLPICPICNAGRGEIATALYQRENGKWHRIVEEYITTFDILCSQIKAKTLLCGEIPPLIEEQLKELLIIPKAPIKCVKYLVKLGWQRLERGDFDDLATLQPLYLRRPAITQPKTMDFSPRSPRLLQIY